MVAQHRDSGDENSNIEPFGPFTLIFDPPALNYRLSQWQCVVRRPGRITQVFEGMTRQEAREKALHHIGQALREEAAS